MRARFRRKEFEPAEGGRLRRPSRFPIVCSVFLALAVLFCGEPDTSVPLAKGEWHLVPYNSEAFSATIMDGRDGTPLEGATVLVIWRTVSARTGECGSTFRIHPAKTDPEGFFAIPRWGPRYVGEREHLDARDPEIHIFKPGYRYRYLDEEGSKQPLEMTASVFRDVEPDDDAVDLPVKLEPSMFAPHERKEFVRSPDGGSRWDGATIELQSAATPEEELRSLAAFWPWARLDSRFDLAYVEVWLAAWDRLPPEVNRRALRRFPDIAGDFRAAAESGIEPSKRLYGEAAAAARARLGK